MLVLLNIPLIGLVLVIGVWCSIDLSTAATPASALRNVLGAWFFYSAAVAFATALFVGLR